MSSLRSLVSVFFALCAIHFAGALHFTPDQADQYLLPSYDYIIVGAGASGLTVANRLSNDPSGNSPFKLSEAAVLYLIADLLTVKVLIIEAGYLDHQRDLSIPNGLIAVPGLIGTGIPKKSMYYWNLTTVAQDALSGRKIGFSQGRAIGGSTLINGLCWTRGAASDFNGWQALGNPGWGWRDMLPYFKKSETFTASNVPDAKKAELHINPSQAYHGDMGPVSVSFPNFFYNQSTNALDGWAELGIPLNEDLNTGSAAGAMIVPSSMTSQDQSRSDARQAHFDPIQSRDNLHILSQMRVTRLVMAPQTNAGGDRRITGVEFKVSKGGRLYSATTNREVILAAGAIWSPTLLQISGIGPKWYLDQIKIPTQIDLAGVGYNFQDHPMVHVSYTYQNKSVFTSSQITGDEFNEVAQEYIQHRTGPWTAPLINTVAFPALSSVVNAVDWIAQRVLPAKDGLPGNAPASVKRGYAAQKQLLRAQLLETDAGVFEILADSTGTLTVSAMKSFSRGTVRPSDTKSVFDQPVLNPRYCSNPIDCDIIALGLQLNRKHIGTKAMSQLQPKLPDKWNTDDRETLIGLLKPLITTEFHPSGTTAMMPLSMGGVVDSNLKVYGTCNLRVVDAGVFPIIPAAHLSAVVYGVAEKAADLIKAGGTCRVASDPTRK
ncbi:hypothetical protein G7046_g2876 [Stylonectria norvegica]|nr:hypothetical protein G7046_g2876 [Stylonectria norvegica]